MTERPKSMVMMAVAAAAAMPAAAFGQSVEILRRGGGEMEPRVSTTGTNSVPAWPVRKDRGLSVAGMKRARTKLRNRLRAKGQHRKAVR